MDKASISAKKFLEDLLSFFGLKVDVTVSLEEDIIQLDVPSTHLNGFLIGSRSETLRAIHSLTAAAVQQSENQYYRLNIDIANYKKQRANRLSRKAQTWIDEVKKKGIDKELKPMNAADRRIVHRLAGSQGVTTESIGEGMQRHIILRKSSSPSSEQ